MRIALINENSQAAKNEMVYNTLKKVAESKGHTVDNYGMYAADDAAQLTYVQNGILAALLINSGAADFVVTGCGTGEGTVFAPIVGLSRGRELKFRSASTRIHQLPSASHEVVS